MSFGRLYWRDQFIGNEFAGKNAFIRNKSAAATG
jgi:hypothetical protein